MRAVRGLVPAAMIALAVMFSACGTEEYPAELMEAKAAVADSKSEGADEACPEEYNSAEEMLQKAEALYAEDETAEMSVTAQETVKLADAAKECAAGKKNAATPKFDLGSLPEELANYNTAVVFHFNDISITPNGAGQLRDAASFIKQQQTQYKFWVLLTAHADRPGTPADNYEISRRRGLVARYFLIDEGVEADRVIIKPVGEYESSQVDKKDVRNQEFRKVEVTLLPYNALDTIKIGSPFFYDGGTAKPYGLGSSGESQAK